MHENKDIVIEPKDLPKMLEQLEDGFYAIPVFQREFVWDIGNIKALWDSIYRHYPIGSFLIWETEERIPKHRKLLGLELKENEKGNFNYILDGQQRITSLLGSIKGAERTATKTFLIYFDLKAALDEKNRSDEEQGMSLFIDEDEFKESDAETKRFIIPVSFLVNFNTPFYRDLLLMGKNEQEIAEFYRNVCDRLKSKYKLSVIRLNKIPIEEVCEIFTRVNQRGKKLTLVELMTAKTYQAKTLEQEEFYLIDWLKELNKGLDREIDGYSDAIDETIFLRLLSIMNKKLCREKDLLALSADTIQELWQNATNAYMNAIRYLKNELNISSPYLIPYPPMLAPLAYFFSKLGNAPLTEDTKKILNSWFWLSSFLGNYQKSTNETVRQDCEMFEKLAVGENKLNIRFNKRLEYTDIIEQELNLNNAFCKAILCVLSYSQPRDFFTHNIVNINEIFIKNKKDELHHIFPLKSEIGKRRKEDAKSVANICFIPKDTNNRISNKNPKDYFMEAKTKNKHFDEDIKSHFIPFEDAINNDFECFLKNRANAILNEIFTLLGITSDIHNRLADAPDKIWNEYELDLRKVIDLELTKTYGDDYWNNGVIPEDIKILVSEKIKRETKLRPDLKEQFETSRAKLDNCDVMDYLKIILKNWNLFETQFGSKEETQNQFKNLQSFRNVLKHIKYSDNKKLDELTQKKGEVSLLWLQKILKINESNENAPIDRSIDEIYSQLKEKILQLGTDISIEPTKLYTAFKRFSNFVCIRPQNTQLKLWLSISKEKWSEPENIEFRDVSEIGHWGTGDYEVILNSAEDIEPAMKLIKQAYELNIKEELVSSSQMDGLFEELKNKILAIEKGITAQPWRNKEDVLEFTKENGSDFAYIRKLRNKIKLFLEFSKEHDLAEVKNLFKFNAEYGSINEYFVYVKTSAMFDSLLPFVKQAYELNVPGKTTTGLDEHFARMRDKEALQQVKALREEILAIGSDIREHYSQSHIKFRRKTDFCQIYCQTDQFWVDIKLNKELITNTSVDIRPHQDDVWTHIRVKKETDISKLLPYIKKAYEAN